MNKLIEDILIKNNALAESSFQIDDNILSLENFLDSADKQNIGVWLDAHDEFESVKDYLSDLPVIALNFPSFSDGRAYSSANMLRRAGYQEEIRAFGDVRIDQLEQMVRCGFDAFQLSDGQNVESAIERLTVFSHSYQPTTDSAPLFRQRV